MTKVENAAPAAKPAPTSENLVQLQNAAKEIGGRLQKAVWGTPEQEAILAELLANKDEQKKEVAAIMKLEAENALALLKAEKIKFVNDAIATAIAASAKNATGEVKQAAQVAYDALVNLVLPTKPAAAATGGTGTKGAVQAEIRALLIEMVNGGMTLSAATKAVQEPPYNHTRGTAGTVATILRNEGIAK